MTALLEVDALTKVFGSLRAVDDCSFEVAERSVTALIGPNGSGKTTLFNMITGYLRPDSGQVRFRNREVTGLDSGRLYRAGLLSPASAELRAEIDRAEVPVYKTAWNLGGQDIHGDSVLGYLLSQPLAPGYSSTS